MPSQTIVVSDLKKQFGNLTAVDGISFTVCEGEIFGILGPNGAGKTTTIRMLTGVIRPTAGEIEIFGLSMPQHSLEIRQHIGVLPETANVYNDLTGEQNLELCGRLYGIDPDEMRERSARLLQEMRLYEHKDRPAKTYSKGMKQKLSLAMTLMSDGQLLFLDEPSSGLDAESAKQVRGVISGLAEEGKTILLTTHNLAEAETLCDRVAIMSHGKIAAIDTPTKLRRSFRERQSVVMEFSSVPDVGALSKLEGITEVQSFNTRVRCFTPEPGEVLVRLVEFAQRNNLKILSAQTEAASLEDVFLSLIRKGA